MSRFAGLPAALRERGAKAEDIEDIEDEDCTDEAGKPVKSKKKDHDMNVTEDAIAQAAAEATAAANARFSSVLADANYAGNESLAQAMLANNKLSAEEITGFLALVPKPSAVVVDEEAQRAAAEEAARDEMRQAIAETGNSAIETGGQPQSSASASAAKVWDTAYANEFGQVRN